MASLNDIYIKIETIETILKTLKNKQEKGINITVSISDEPNKFGQNVSAFVSQSKEQRDAKKDKFFVGNGNTFWSNGNQNVIRKGQAVSVPQPTQPAAAQSSNDDDGLPF